MFSKPLTKNWHLLIPLLFAITALSFNFNKPFIGHHDFTGAFNGMIARNYLEVGIWELKFGQVTSFVKYGEPASYYTHYLPLLPLLIAFSFSIFGVVEWAARLVPSVFSLIGVLSLFLICRKVWGTGVGIFASFFFCFNPMFIYFGSMPVPEPALIGVMLLSFYIYLCWIEKFENKYLIYLTLSFLIGGFIGWPIYYLGPLLLLHSFLLNKFRWKLLIPQLAFLFTFIMLFVHAYILTGNFFGGGLLETFENRFKGEGFSFGGENYSILNYLKKEISWWQAYFTRILLVLGLIGCLSQIKNKFKLKGTTLLILFLFGISHISIFSRYTFVHDFLNIYLLPFFALSGALGIEFMISLSKRLRIKKAVISMIIFLFLFAFTIERFEFTKALLASDMNKKGIEMAKIINGLQTGPNQVVIVSKRFNNFFGIFTSFYSKYPYSFADEEIFSEGGYKKYQDVITIDEDITNKENYQFMLQKYPYEKKGDITIFKIYE